MRHLIAPVPSVSTRTLLAAFMAAAFALLMLLPAFGQSTFDRTDGRISSGGLSVGVFADIEDAQLAKNRETTYGGETVYRPVDPASVAPIPGTTPGTLLRMDTAYLANGLAAPQSTFFGDTLWVSNDTAAYNTILITAESALVADTESDDGCVTATVRSPRTSNPITVQMALTSITGAPDQMASYYQAFVRVLDARALDGDGDPLYASSHGPDCVDSDDVTDDTPNYDDGVIQADTASILARHEDRITISVAGAGEVTVDVDGEGPDLLDITPEDLNYVRSSSLDYSFVVRDNESGLRHDGELVVTEDGGLHGSERGWRPRHDR